MKAGDMTRIAATLLLALTLLMPLAQAQDADESDKRVAIASRIVERTWSDTKRTIEIMRDQIAQTLPIDQREIFRDMLNEHFDFTRYKQLNTAMMARHFTVGELTALDNFYASAEGQSVMQKMPLVMSEMMPFAQQLILDAIRKTPRDKRPPQMRDL
jgi:hypothetical protein